MEYEAGFRPVLDVILYLLKTARRVRLWSGESGTAPGTDVRESPFDGDSFRQCEQEVVRTHGAEICVLGLHVYIDGSQLSWSGGTFTEGFSSGWSGVLVPWPSLARSPIAERSWVPSLIICDKSCV